MNKISVSKYFKYKEIKKDPKNIEFGWAECEPIRSGRLVVATSSDLIDWDNAATLSDYENFFLRFTKSTPANFLEKWRDSHKEYSLFWYNHMPNSDPNSHEFFLKLSELIVNKNSFEHTFTKGTAKYLVVDVSDETKGSSTGNKD